MNSNRLSEWEKKGRLLPKVASGWLVVALGCGLALTAGEAARASSPRQEAMAPRGDYRIGAGDVLNIVVWRNEELTLTVPVRPDGWISLPLVNDVRVSGLTPMELQETLTEMLQEFVSQPVVSIIVAQVGSFHVSVLGKVRQPGRFLLSGPTTVLEVLAMAGGTDEFASTGDIVILRALETTYQRIPFDFPQAISSGGKNVNIDVRKGDIIFVP